MGRYRPRNLFSRPRRPTIAATIAGMLLLVSGLTCLSCIGMFGGRGQRQQLVDPIGGRGSESEISRILHEAAEETRKADGPDSDDVGIFNAETDAGESITGTVTAISDGDTLTVLHDRRQFKIRLHGIDTPETGQAFGSRAKETLGDLVFNKDVMVKIHGQDRYKRYIGEVMLDGKSINRQMVDDGFAWHYVTYSSDASLAAAESSARSRKAGLWADPEPVAPWDYRRNQRAEAAAKRAGRAVPEPEPSRPAAAPVPVRAPSPAASRSYWLNTSSGVRHNGSCKHYGNTKNGRSCGLNEGRACGICGG